MTFIPIKLKHRQRAPWDKISHVRLLPGARPDTDIGRRIMDHIRLKVDQTGVAALTAIQPNFPARQKHLESLLGMRFDLRHMANERTSGTSDENKGLIELGTIT